MRGTLVLALVLAMGGGAAAGELGVRLTWNGDWSGVAWASCSGEFGGLSFALREEVDILTLSHRILSGQVRASREWWESSLSGKLLASGRLDLSGKWELRGTWELGPGEVEAQAGLGTSWAGVTSGGPLSYRGWGQLELSVSPGWGELRWESPLPQVAPRWQLAAGLRGESWCSWRASWGPVGPPQLSLELGAGEGELSASSFFTLLPSPGGGGSVRLGGGPWSLKLGLNARPGSWRLSGSVFWDEGGLSGKLTLRFSRAGWSGGTAELGWEW